VALAVVLIMIVATVAVTVSSNTSRSQPITYYTAAVRPTRRPSTVPKPAAPPQEPTCEGSNLNSVGDCCSRQDSANNQIYSECCGRFDIPSSFCSKPKPVVAAVEDTNQTRVHAHKFATTATK
jgi:hypothetical protein